MMTILITGATGLVGKQLSKQLKEKGYKVAILSRANTGKAEPLTYIWNIEKKEIENASLKSIDYIIHLAGANIGEKRWTTKRRKIIIDSRVKSSELLFDKIKNIKIKPKAFISASAIGYYGAEISEKIYCESDPPASDFLGETCTLWEQAVDKFEKIGIRTVKIRSGIVLTKHGGALEKMIKPMKFRIGSVLGSGKQYMPWIHIDDLCNIYMKAIEDTQMKGAYNAVAPAINTNSDFTLTLARVLNTSLWLPNIPPIVIKLIFGKMSAMLLRGSRVSSEKIIQAGYSFKFTNLEDALINLLAKNPK